MGLLDNLKDRLGMGDSRASYYEDDYYEDDPYEQDAYDDTSHRHADTRGGNGDKKRTGSGLLGNTPRPDAESVSVYTRSGRPLGSNAGADQSSAPAQYSHNAVPTPPNAHNASTTGSYPSVPAPYGVQAVPGASSMVGAYEQDVYTGTAGTAGHVVTTTHATPGDIGLTPIPRTSGKLPPYVLKPKEYEDVQVMVSRVRTNQPVVLDFSSARMDTAKRILDFAFGFATGMDGVIRELGDRCFVVLPHAVELTSSELNKLKSDGVVKE